MNQNQPFLKYSTMTIEDTVSQLNTSIEKGLSTQEVEKRKKANGSNELKEENNRIPILLIRQIRSPFNALFLCIAILSLCAGEFQNSFFITIFVLINISVSLYQEYKAEKELRSLRKYLIDTIQVIRDGKPLPLPASQLVPGDIIHLYPGTIIPADIRFVKTDRCLVDESALTGESKESPKDTDPVKSGAVTIFNAQSIGFAGTTIISGKGVGAVIATGTATVMGNVAQLTETVQRESEFTQEITKLSKIIVWQVFISLAVAFAINMLIKGLAINFLSLLIFLLTLTITVIPEALPVVVTFTLARGVSALARKKVVVRRLSAIEDLGSIDVLCTDKTGTITENILTLQDIKSSNPRQTLLYGALASESTLTKEKMIYKGFDQVIWHSLTQQEIAQLEKYTLVAEFPFDPSRRKNSAVVKSGNTQLLIVRGMAEAIIPFCTASDAEKTEIRQWLHEQEVTGKRTLTIAYKTVTNSHVNPDDETKNLTFSGIITFIDPLKKSAPMALQEAHKLGVQVKIMSGDTPEVCGAVAQQIGLIQDIKKEVITGYDFAQLNEQEKLQTVKRVSVFARIPPEQKYEIITLLQSVYLVGYVGDGINDAPALKAANVSLVVPEATDIARQAADIVLLEKNLHTMIIGIREGRRIFCNVLKFVRTALSTNLGNFYSISIISLFINFLPMLPIQLITINLLTDFPFIAISTDHVAPGDIKRKESYKIGHILVLITLMAIVSSLFDFMYFMLFRTYEPPLIQSGWFVLSVLTEIVIIFSLRSNQPIWRSSLPSWQLTTLSIIVIAITLALPYSTLGQQWFLLTPLPKNQLGTIFGLVAAYFIISEIVKRCSILLMRPGYKTSE